MFISYTYYTTKLYIDGTDFIKPDFIQVIFY